MPIDWNMPLVTRDGRPAELMPVDGWQRTTGDTRRRVRAFNDRSILRDSASAKDAPYTIWLHSEEGRCNTGGKDSPMGVFNDAA